MERQEMRTSRASRGRSRLPPSTLGPVGLSGETLVCRNTSILGNVPLILNMSLVLCLCSLLDFIIAEVCSIGYPAWGGAQVRNGVSYGP